MIPDDRPGRPLTPGEQAAIADLERRILLDAPVRGHERKARRVRGGARPGAAAFAPLIGLLGTACVLVVVLILAGGGLLGGVAVLVSVVATALVWPLLPAALGGPRRPGRPPFRTRGPLRGPR